MAAKSVGMRELISRAVAVFGMPFCAPMLQGMTWNDEKPPSASHSLNLMRVSERHGEPATRREGEAPYQLAARGSSAGLWELDLKKGALLLAPRFKELLGYPEHEGPDTLARLQDVLHPDEREAIRQALREHLAQDARFELECRLRHRDGAWRWFLASGVAERDAAGRAVRMAGSIVDITGRKQAELALENANRAKDEILATLAHELRNPLAPIRSGLDILKRDTSNGPASERARQVMERQLLHMVRIMDDLLDSSRISNGKVHLDMGRVPLNRAIETAVELNRPAIQAHGHELVLDLPSEEIVITGDSTRLAQVVGILLNNAIKYTPHRGRVEVRLRLDGPEAVIEVRDNGVGIPMHMLEDVFSLFTQVERRIEKARGGLGIGLYLARKLVELHHGTVTAESAGRNHGSTFTVRLPRGPACGSPCMAIDERCQLAASEHDELRAF